jgi:hypothetical protein
MRDDLLKPLPLPFEKWATETAIGQAAFKLMRR